MFEISIPGIKKCILQLESQQKKIADLAEQLETIKSQMCQLTEERTELTMLQNLIDSLYRERDMYSVMISTLENVTDCYVKTEKSLLQEPYVQRNQFVRRDFTGITQMLYALDIKFNN